jgi:hypothetical protein
MMRVYISSTYQDLKKQRQAAAEAARLLGCQPIAMEDYVARDERPLDVCVADVRRSDIYVGIIAWRYGFRPPGQASSITHLEYEAARDSALPCFWFLHSEEMKLEWPGEWIDEGPDAEALMAFRHAISERHTASFFPNTDKLQVLVSSALSLYLSRNARIGKPQVPALLPYLADRSRQCDQLENGVEEHARFRPRRPLVLLIHGDERESHETFVERLQNHTLPRLLKLRPESEPVHRLDLRWIDPAGTLDERRQRLRSRLGEVVKGDRRASLDEVAHELAQHRCPVMIASFLLSEEWRSDEPQLIGDWLEIWKSWQDLPADQHLLPVLCIQYKNADGLSWMDRWRIQRLNRRVEGFVAGIDLTNQQKFTGIKLDRLERVEERHVIAWIESEAASFCRHVKGVLCEPRVLAERLKPWARGLFRTSRERTDTEGIPMETLAGALRAELKRYLAEGSD